MYNFKHENDLNWIYTLRAIIRMESQQILQQVLSVFCHQAALTRSHVSTKQHELIPSWPLPLEQRARAAITWI